MGVALAWSLGACGRTSTPANDDGGNASAPAPPRKPTNCSELANDGPGQLTVRIVNRSSSPVHLASQSAICASGSLFRIHDQVGKAFAPHSTACDDCAKIAAGASGGCYLDCPSVAISLGVGESVEVPWTGIVSEVVELPSQCGSASAHSNGKPICWRGMRLPPGTYAFSAAAGRALDCSSSGGSCTACEPRDGGGCESFAATVPNLDLMAETWVDIANADDFGQASGVELVFSD